MIEIAPDLFVGSDADYEKWPEDAFVIHAAREPHHRAFLGYTGRAAPKDNGEYLFARRGDRLALNLVDVPNPDWVSPRIVEAAVLMTLDAMALDKPLILHCNQGLSRSPWLAAYIAHRLGLEVQNWPEDEMGIGMHRWSEVDFATAEAVLKALIPDVKTEGSGMREWVKQHWDQNDER